MLYFETMGKRFLRSELAPALIVAAAVCCVLASCRTLGVQFVPGPSVVSFPLVEDGSLEIDGAVIAPAGIRGDVMFVATRKGFVYAVGMTSRRVLWRFDAKQPLREPPEIGERLVYIREDPDILCALDSMGHAAFTMRLPALPATAVREYRGRLYFGSADGRLFALDPEAAGRTVWEFRAAGPVRVEPAFSAGRIFFAAGNGLIHAVDSNGKVLWTFDPHGAVDAAPGTGGGRVYFGTAAGDFYALEEATGRRKWVFKLGAAPVHPARVTGDRIVLAASNSVVYCFSAKGGEILWWRNVPARIVYQPVIANGTVLLTGLGPDLLAVELVTGKPSGHYSLSEELLSGPLWVPPRLVLLESSASDEPSRVLFLGPDVRLSAAAEPPSLSSPHNAVEVKAATAGFDHPFYEFFLAENGRPDLRQGPSIKDSWTWHPAKAGCYTIIVRAFDRLQSRETRLRFIVENGSGKN